MLSRLAFFLAIFYLNIASANQSCVELFRRLEKLSPGAELTYNRFRSEVQGIRDAVDLNLASRDSLSVENYNRMALDAKDLGNKILDELVDLINDRSVLKRKVMGDLAADKELDFSLTNGAQRLVDLLPELNVRGLIESKSFDSRLVNFPIGKVLKPILQARLNETEGNTNDIGFLANHQNQDAYSESSATKLNRIGINAPSESISKLHVNILVWNFEDGKIHIYQKRVVKKPTMGFQQGGR